MISVVHPRPCAPNDGEQTMASNFSRPERWGDLKKLTSLYPLKKTVAYKLLGEGKLRARKLGGKTIWDLDSAEEFFEGLPEVDQAA
jgi:hypothetical protein